MMASPTAPSCKVILLGDRDTGQRVDALAKRADQHGATIIEVYTYDEGAVTSCESLADVDVVITALGRAIGYAADIWVPFPMPDLGREQHARRLSLVLQRHGINLRLGSNLWPCPTTGGMNEADFALRREVQTVDELDHAALAAGAFQTLGTEIELALTAACTSPTIPEPERLAHDLSQLELQHGPKPVLPATTAPWSQRRPALKRYAEWLVNHCGLTQTAAAKVITASGHRTPQGRAWRQPTVSALIRSSPF